MTTAEIQAILARAEAASPGPWCVDWTALRLDAESDVYVQRDATSDDGIFISHSRTDIPALCRDLLAAREALRGCAVCSGCHERCERYNAALGEEVRP